MTKEKLTIENARQDLFKVLECRKSNAAVWRFTYIVPITMLAVSIGIILRRIWIGLLIFSVALYHIVRLVVDSRRQSAVQKQLESSVKRGDFSVSKEILSHIAEETIYEPHWGRRTTHTTKIITVYYFSSGAQWRLPWVDKHYEWSKDFYLSSKGLENTSVSGDEFYFISLQGNQEIGYIYNTKLFDFQDAMPDRSSSARS